MPIEAFEPLVSFISANIVWLTIIAYVGTVAVKLAGHDRNALFGLSYMELFAIGMSALFTYTVISPANGLENLLSQLSWAVLAYAVVKPLVSFGID